jgi:hypothetical protein
VILGVRALTARGDRGCPPIRPRSPKSHPDQADTREHDHGHKAEDEALEQNTYRYGQDDGTTDRKKFHLTIRGRSIGFIFDSTASF